MVNIPPSTQTNTPQTNTTQQQPQPQSQSQPSQPSQTNDFIDYQGKNGAIIRFDTGYAACSKFGFLAGTRVTTPKGTATVIGVSGNNLWFHIDGDPGASFWDGFGYEKLLEIGIVALPQQEFDVGLSASDYRLKRIDHLGKALKIILQNQNGPCPLIAVANVLALRGSIVLDGKNDRMSVDDVCSNISKFLQTKHGSPEMKEEVEKVSKILPDLKVGLDVNFTFNGCDTFEVTQKTRLFQLLEIRLLHGWLVDPQLYSAAAAAIGQMSYNDVTLQLVLNESEPDKTESPSVRRLNKSDCQTVNQFLSDTSSQLTEYGLRKLHEVLQEGELSVFFRNNHFTTLTKYKGELYNLVTDIGYERERLIVWEKFSTVHGESIYTNGDFMSTDVSKTEEIINTVILCGWTRDDAVLAMNTIRKPHEELKVDDVLQWLSVNRPLGVN